MAGLDPEDVTRLLQGNRQLGAMTQQGIRDIVSQRNRVKDQKRADIIRQEKRTAMLAKQQARTVQEAAKADAKIAAVKLADAREKENIRLRETVKTPVIKNITVNEQLRLDDRVKDEIASIAPAGVDKNGKPFEIPFEERKANAIQANHRAGNPVYYSIVEEVVEEDGGFAFFDKTIPGEITPVYLPKNPKTDVQVTSQDVIDTMNETGMTEEEVLKAIGAI